MRKIRNAALIGLIALLSSAGCSLTGVDRERVVAAISGFNDDDPQVRLTQSGSSVQVEVDSYGASCHEKGETEVEVDQENLIATVTPYDYRPADCHYRDLATFKHSVSVDFAGAGTARIRVRGVQFGGDGGLIVETREIEVGR